MPVQENIQELFKVKGCVYMATSPSGKKYIGMTTHFYNRYHSHKHDAKIKSYSICSAINKYGIENFTWEILHQSDNINELEIKEQYFIKEFNTQNPKIGYNLHSGGKSYRPTRETILKQQKAKGLLPISIFQLPDLTYIATCDFAKDCSDITGVPLTRIQDCTWDGDSTKSTSGYYFTRNSVEYVTSHTEEIIKQITTKKPRSQEARDKMRFPKQIEEKDRVAFNRTGRKFIISYLFSRNTETHSSIELIGKIIGMPGTTIHDKLSKNSVIFFNEFKVVEI